jgi:hypothetical protein
VRAMRLLALREMMSLGEPAKASEGVAARFMSQSIRKLGLSWLGLSAVSPSRLMLVAPYRLGGVVSTFTIQAARRPAARPRFCALKRSRHLSFTCTSPRTRP